MVDSKFKDIMTSIFFHMVNNLMIDDLIKSPT